MNLIPMIDWLGVSLDIADYNNVSKNLREKLEQLKILSQEKKNNFENVNDITVDIGDERFIVLPNGSTGYAYILHNDRLELRIAKIRSKNEENFPLFVHFKSDFLWSTGPINVWYWFINWTEKHIGKVTNNKLNRADLCCHVGEMNFLMSDIENFKGRYRYDNIRRGNRNITGFEFGSRTTQTIFCRIYDKTQEISDKRSKLWFKEIWNEKGLKNKVWNIEFELHRNYFKEVKINTAETLFDRLKDIWVYLTSDWLVWLEKRNKEVDKCKPNNKWVEIQNAFEEFNGCGYISRQKQKQYRIDPLLDSGMGCLTSFMALNELDNISDGLELFQNMGTKRLANKGKNLSSIVENKKKLIH